MAPLVFLLVSFAIFYAINRFALNGRASLSKLGAAAMSVMLIVTGIAHFSRTDVMVATMPNVMPWKREIVYFTGVCEFLAAVGLLVPRLVRLTAILLIAYFIAVLPANIVGSFKAVELGGMEYGPWYLLFRVPLQLFFIWWVWYFTLKTRR
jgi:uncharacterized membrane protein